MELILWRHADAEDGIPDEERRLSPVGVDEAGRMAGWLARHLPADMRVLASPARRAQETARALTEKFETARAVGTGANPQSVLAAAGWPHGVNTVVVGHQPTLGQVAALLLTGEPQEWSIRKGGVWWFRGRTRGSRLEVVVRAVIAPDLLEAQARAQ